MIKKTEFTLSISLFLLFFVNQVYSQKITKDLPLSKIIDETSGLEIVDDLFITHNDSGGEASVYYLSKKGQIVEKRKLKSTSNNDWEDITKDDEYLYVSDSGNNYNNRKDLKIYKVPIDKNSNEKNQTIYFKYPEQDSFKINRNTIYDAEGLISVGTNLIIFTKNRANKITELYSVPKKPGKYDAKKIGSINVQSIVTGADYRDDLRILALTSTIDFNNYYLLLLKNFDFSAKPDYTIDMYEIPIGKSQVEAIKIINPREFWLTSEDENSTNSARLFSMKL